MLFDVYNPYFTKEGKWAPGVKPEPHDWGWIVDNILKNEKWCKQIDEYRKTGNKDLKSSLPSICFVGRSTTTRQAAAMTPTQLFMIDIDHCKDPRGAWQKMLEQVGNDWMCDNVMVAHISPGGEGLHIILKQMGHPTLIENMNAANEIFDFAQYGDYDTKVSDFSRVSFAFKYEETLFENVMLFTVIEPDFGNVIVNDFKNEDGGTKKSDKADLPELSEEEKNRFDSFEYRGTPVAEIIKKWVEVKGKPSSGEIHNFYNEMVKYFRCICDNNKRLLLYLLPRFGHTEEECWGQIKSICRVNTLSSLPKTFYFFLKDNGYYREENEGRLKEYMLSESIPQSYEPPPYLPPVIRELVGTAPADFVIPSINALMPILGTLTSYAGAFYPYDNRLHTTSFFSVIYAPPGTGKGFVERFIELLFADLKLRDFVQSERENLYLRTMQQKGANDKAPDMPHVSLRIIPPKNSEAEFLQKQRDNHGYHMFTYAAEMDAWAKGVKAAGGNKDDMIRIAWDNGEYGQQFKSVNTFKGNVNLFWNVLITGTWQQCENYFKNVENGLVTRCCFTSIENQEFALAPQWKSLNKKSMDFIQRFLKRCDENTYETPCNVDLEFMETLSEKDFDKEVDWRFKFKERQIFDCSWIMPVIDQFHKEEMEKAALDIDRARDVFRRRVGVRGFRLALMCMCLYKKISHKDKENCKKFIRWWMDRDLESMLAIWGNKYNEATEEVKNISQRSVFDALSKEFTKNDVYSVCRRQDIKTPIRIIVHRWRKLGIIKDTDEKGTYIKV